MANNTISSSKYDIYQKYSAIMQHYFGKDVDYMRAGLMAYITECMALFTRDSAIHKDMLYKESYLNTAIMPQTIYNYAKMFDISIQNATPAYADIMLTMNTADLETMISKRRSSDSSFAKYGSDVSNIDRNCMVIDRSNQIISGEYYFALERSIIIYKNDNDSFIVRYCNTELPSTTEFGDNTTTFLKTVITSSGSERYLSFIVRAYQYKINHIQKQITSSSFIDTKVHTFKYDDQLAGVRLQYKKNNKTTSIPLVFSDSIINNEEKYAYYNISDDNEIEIRFLNGVFLPSVGSTLLVDIYTTYGASGNTTFTGDATFTLSDEDYRTLAIIATFTDNQSYGGKDAPTLQETKSNIINQISSRDCIITENDLNTYFNGLKQYFSTVNDGELIFQKKRDDLIRRVYNAYLLLRTGLEADGSISTNSRYVSKVIPTRTVDATFPITNNISKPFGSILEEHIDGDTFNYSYVPIENETSGNEYYIVPFYMRVMLYPIKKVKYLYNLTNDSTALTYVSIEQNGNGNIVLTPSTVAVNRGIDGYSTSKRYTFTFSFASNKDISQIWGSNKITFHIYKSKNNYQAIEIGLNSSPNDNECGFSIISEKEDNSDVYNTSFIISIPVSEEEFSFTDKDDFGTYINLFAGSNIKAAEDIYVGLKIDATLESEMLNVTFKSDTKLSLFRNLDTILNSDLVLNTITKYYVTYTRGGNTEPEEHEITAYQYESILENTSDSAHQSLYYSTDRTGYEEWENLVIKSKRKSNIISSIKVKEIPVVHSSFFNNEANQTKFIKQLFIYIEMLKENMSKLETNTYFNLKFENTHGLSQLYDTVNINLKLELDIVLYNRDATIESQIRDYIRAIVDNCNNVGSMEVSNIIAYTTAAYNKYIHHIVFKGLNGTFDQHVDKLDINSTNYVPEHFNLDTESLEDSITFSTVDD